MSSNDSNTDESSSTESDSNNKLSELKLILTNARSLAPKIRSLITMFDEMKLHFALVTESWLRESELFDRDIIDLEHGSDLKIIYKNRPQKRTSARRVGGGVSLVYSRSRCSFKERKIAGNRFELVVAVGRVSGIKRQVVIFTLYIEPRMKVADLADLKELIGDQLLQIKANGGADGPIIFLGGDMNRRDITDALADFPDMKQNNFEPTRGMACLDLVYSNANVTNVENVRPLENEDGVSSDHQCVYLNCEEESNAKNFRWLRKTTRVHSEQACRTFGEKLTATDWQACLGDENVNQMVENFQKYTCNLVDTLFPFKTFRSRSNEHPWITHGIRALSKRKKRVYKREGRSNFWWRLQERSDELIEQSGAKYVRRVKKGGARAYFSAIKELNCKEKPKQWSVNDIFPDDVPEEVGKKVADYFTEITNKFDPLLPCPPSGARRRPVTLAEVETKLRKAKKPNSSVQGDLLPRLVRRFHKLLAVPMQLIYNKVFEDEEWPKVWKCETAVIIPKTSNPTNLGECRNISCTNFFSKVLESIMLDDLRAEIPLDPTQYGGMKGCSVDHLLVDAHEDVLGAIDEGKHSVMLGVDYQKAFNRLDHAVCIQELTRLGASAATISIIRSFLTNRRMRVRLPDGSLSEERPLFGGSPQGSILGCLLYCLATQQIDRSVVGRETERTAASPLQITPSSSPAPAGLSPTERGFRLLEDGDEDESRSLASSDDSFHTADGSISGDDQIDDQAMTVRKYVDDTTSFEAVPVSQGIKHFTTSTTLEEIRPDLTRRFLEGVIEKSGDIGMVVNCAKTQLLVLSTNNGCSTKAKVALTNGTTIQSGESLKLLGFVFNEGADMSGQFENIKRKFRARFWSLVHLRKSGIVGFELYKMYCVFVRSVIETNCVVYHSMLTRFQSNEIEKMQKRVLRLCFGFNTHYADSCETWNISRLDERRQQAQEKFVQKALQNPRFKRKWFVEREAIQNDLRWRKPYVEKKARTSKYYHSPLLTMQRIANRI